MAILSIWINPYTEWDKKYYWILWYHENISWCKVVEVWEEIIEKIRYWTQEEVEKILSLLYNK